MLSLDHILISDLVVTNLFMHSLPGMIILYLAAPFFTLKGFLHSASVIRVGVAYVNVRVSRRLKEELSWAIDKQFRLIINTLLFKTVIPVRN